MDAFIGNFLERLLATSVQTVVLTALVWALCRWVPRLSPAAQCWLWWFVALQALAGLVAPPIQLPWLPQTNAPASGLVSTIVRSPIAIGGVPMGPQLDHGVPAWQLALFLLWAGGFAVMAWATLRDWRRARVLLQSSSPCTDENLLQLMARASTAQGLRNTPRMRLSHHIESPVVIGPLRPVLLLPALAPLSAAELDMALAHELAHLRRGDLWWGCIPALLRHLFFFNPFAHLAVREYAIAREADCDAAVVEMDQYSRRDYGCLLLRLGTRPGADRELAVASPTFRSLSRRLTMLQNTSSMPRVLSIAILAVVAAVGVMPLRLVAAAAAPATRAAAPKPDVQPNATPAATDARPDIKDIDFRRTGNNPAIGRLIVTLNGSRIPVKLSRQGNRVVVEFTDAELPTVLQRRYDVAQFATPVSSFEAMPTDSGARLVVSTTGDFEQHAYQAGDQFVVEIQARSQTGVQAEEKPVYTGARMSGSFQDIPTRTLLQLLSETSGRSIVVDDAITGNVTFRVDRMPWDQVLDIVLRIKGLDKSIQGDVIRVFPAVAHQVPAIRTPPDPANSPRPAL